MNGRNHRGLFIPGQIRAFSCWALSFLGLSLVALSFPALSGVTRAQIRLISDLTHHFTVAPGETHQGLLLLENAGDEPARVRIYQTDFRFDAEGHSYYEAPGTLPRSNAPWIRIGQPLVTVPPHASMSVVYRVSVPDDGTLSGTYWSMIMVEPLPPESAAGGPSPEPIQVGLTQRFRYGIQVVTDAGQTGEPRLVFHDPALILEKTGAYRFQVDLTNDGDRWVNAAVWMEVYSESGERLGRFDGRRMRLYPGTSGRARISLGTLAPGRYQALFIADGGGAAVFGARYRLNISSP